MRDTRPVGFDLPDGIPPWLAAFVQEALRETETLRENGAEQATSARLALLKKLVTAAAAFLDAEIDTHQAAREAGRCQETVRRAIREGALPDRRATPRGRHRIRRGDLHKLAAQETRPYDPDTDAQDIARLRRML